jgi:WD40 repeat protein
MVGVFESGLDTVVDIDWSADGRWLAGAWTDFRTHRNAKTHLWSMPDGALVREFDTPFFAWSPQQAQIALGSAHGTNDLTIWDMETGQSRTIYHKVTAARTNFPAWSPDGARIATGLGHRRFGRVWLWPVTGEAGELAFNPADLTVGTLAITWSHDARQLVMSGWNGVVRVFDAQTGEPRWLAIALVNGETVSLTAAGEVLNASPGALAELVYSVEKPDGAIE